MIYLKKNPKNKPQKQQTRPSKKNLLRTWATAASKGSHKHNKIKLFLVVVGDTRSGSDHAFHPRRFRLDDRKSLFIRRVVDNKNRLLREIVVSILEGFQGFSLLFWSMVSDNPALSSRLDQVTPKSPFEPTFLWFCGNLFATSHSMSWSAYIKPKQNVLNESQKRTWWNHMNLQKQKKFPCEF